MPRWANPFVLLGEVNSEHRSNPKDWRLQRQLCVVLPGEWGKQRNAERIGLRPEVDQAFSQCVCELVSTFIIHMHMTC